MGSEELFTGERFVPGIMDPELEIEHFQRYGSIAELVRNKIVVDAACGEGYGTALIGKTAKTVDGFDIDMEAVHRATMNYGADNVHFHQGNIISLPLENHYADVFVSFETIEHVDETTQKQFMQEVKRVLKEDGILIISSPNKKIYSDLFDYHNKFHVHEMYKEEFVDLLSAQFKHVNLYHQYFEVASIIDNNEIVAPDAKYIKNREKYNFDGKYFIAIASNREIDDIVLQSVYLNQDVTYLKNIQRILQLQSEEEERNKHIKKLDQHIEELGVAIRTLQEENKECQSQVIEAQSKLIQALEDNRKLLDEKQKEVNEKQKEIDKKQKEIDEHVFQLDSQKYELDKKNELIIDKNRHIQNIEAQIALDNQKINELQLPADKWNRFIMFFPIRALRYIKRNIKKLYLRTKEKKYEKLVVPSFSHPKVSIIIPVYNQFDYTYACIKSIIETVKEVPYEIIIGDDMSTDRTKRIKKYISGICVNMNRTDHGFLMNCNRAAKLAKGDYIVFLNNDTQVKEEWLSSLVQLIESDDKIGMVGSKLVYPDGRLQEAGGIIWDDASGWNYGREQDANMPEYNYVREVDYISGASIMIHRNLWEQIGGFDPYFAPAYCEDSDLAFQVRQQGYKVMYQPKSVVVHFEGVSNGTDLNAGLKKYQVENNRKFREKWAEELKCQYPSGQDAFLARERNRGKKVILIIDHYVPTYDKDAGSKTTFQYIKMFLKKGYMVKFIGDNYAQMEPYTTILQQMGVEVLYGPWYAQHIFEWIDMNKQYIDIAYLNRPHITEKYIDYLKENTDIKLIYYGHDLHFLRTQREAEIEGNADKIVESKMWQYKEFDIMKKASVSYYPSIVEEEAIHEIDPSVKVKAITAYVFDKFKENYQYNYAKREGIMFVGGFSHGPNIDAVKWFVEEIWPEIHRCTDAKFYIVGSNAPDEIKNLDGDGIVFKGFVSDEELSRLYEECRMIVVPLRYGAGVKGKVVEAIYNGLPIITTSVGAEGISGVEEVAAIADDAQEFANQVVKLYTDGETLEKMAQSTQRFIKDNFSVDAVWSIIKEDFE